MADPRAHWGTPLGEYGRLLRANAPRGTWEPEMEAAFRAEGARLGLELDLDEVVVCTAQHVTPTNGPGFGAADLIAAAGLPPGKPLLVAAWSGVAFSNTAWSGALSHGGLHPLLKEGPEKRRQEQAARERSAAGTREHRISLIPSRIRDGLVFRAPMTERTLEVLEALRPEVRALIADPRPGEDYPTWALRCCAGIQSRLLGRPVHYLDLCRIAEDYLLRSGIAARLGGLAELLPDEPWYTSGEQKVRLHGPEGAPPGACPGLILAFGPLAARSGARLLGSFNQERYLAGFVRAFQAIGAARGPADDGPTFVGGRLPGEAHPLDLALEGRSLGELVPAEAPMSILWAPIAHRL